MSVEIEEFQAMSSIHNIEVTFIELVNQGIVSKDIIEWEWFDKVKDGLNKDTLFEWKPIQTAPMNGGVFVLASFRKNRNLADTYFWDICECYWSECEREWLKVSRPNDIFENPEFWINLPRIENKL